MILETVEYDVECDSCGDICVEVNDEMSISEAVKAAADAGWQIDTRFRNLESINDVSDVEGVLCPQCKEVE